jgi:hypothetical protein
MLLCVGRGSMELPGALPDAERYSQVCCELKQQLIWVFDLLKVHGCHVQVLLKKEVHEGSANKALVHLMKLTHNRLMKISGGDLTAPILALQDEVFHDPKGEKFAIPQTSITGLATSKVRHS